MIIVTISTLFSRINRIKPEQFPKHPLIKYVISCQGSKEKDNDYYDSYFKMVFGSDVIWGVEHGQGLSNNRNNAIKLACESFSERGFFIYICDDDVTLNIDGLLELMQVMRVDNLICSAGRVSTDDGFFKKYSECEYRITRINAAKICSVELVVSLDFLRSSNVRFDERFGLGAKYPSGEEFIFINDIINKKGIIKYIPVTLCFHPPASSGDDFYSNKFKIMAKGAMFRRVFGLPICLLMILVFSLKKYTLYKRNVSFARFVLLSVKGACYMEGE